MRTLGRYFPWQEMRGIREKGGVGPFRDMDQVFREVERRAKNFWGEDFPFQRDPLSPRKQNDPRIDMYEEKDRYVVHVEVPGVEKDDIYMTVGENTLLIRGESKKEGNADEKDYIHRERYYGNFSRSIKLPSPVKENEIKATFKNGILKLELPKAEVPAGKEIKIEVE